MIKRGKAEKATARSARLAAALRENLKRRKAQARGRSTPPAPGADANDAGDEIRPQDPDFRRNRSNT